MNHIAPFARHFTCFLLISTLFFTVGCQTPDEDSRALDVFNSLNQERTEPSTNSAAKALILHEGDVVRVNFPGSPNLNSVQQIRRDGRITLELAGEVTAAGLTPKELEKEIIRLCGPQLISKEVVVTVDSSTFPVFVSGAVVRPGRITSDRPITALQAIMEAGGFDQARANLSSVRVIRQEGGTVRNFKLNLKSALEGKATEPFNLISGDIVYVPEKFAWF